MTGTDEHHVRMLCTFIRSGQKLSNPLRRDGNLLCFDMSDINIVHYALVLNFIQMHKGITVENYLE